MIKYFFLFILGLFVFNAAFAQRDTAVYYLQNSGKVVSTKDSADFFLVILPPDTSVDKKLFIVKEYYSNGKIGLIGNSITNSLNLKFQGARITFFPNGHKKEIANFENGEQLGDVIEYYPNGKIYNTKTYIQDKKPLLNDCRDSTGTVLAEKGNGKWIKFIDAGFKNFVEGNVVNGMEDGEWRGKLDDTLDIEWKYENGYKVSSKTFDKKGKEIFNQIFTLVEHMPEFPGGYVAYKRFLANNLQYSDAARESGVEGRVVVNFVVEADGSLSGIRVYKGVDKSVDGEAVRVMKLSPLWNPGTQNGVAVRVAYSATVEFKLGH